MDRIGARREPTAQTMKHRSQIIRWSGLVAAIGLLGAMSPGAPPESHTKPFKETGLEPFLTGVTPGSFEQQLFVDARALYGTEVWAGVILHTSQNNVGGAGSGLVLEAVFADPTAPAGVVVCVMKYEVVANGDQLVFGGSFVPQADGSLVADLEFFPSEGTGRFAGATGSITKATATPGPGYILEGTITTVGAAKKTP
jgi:hypothetical protein